MPHPHPRMSRSLSLPFQKLSPPGGPAHCWPKSKMPFLKCKSDHVLAQLQNLPTGVTPGLVPWQSRLPGPHGCLHASLSLSSAPHLLSHFMPPPPIPALHHSSSNCIYGMHQIRRSPPPGMQLPLESLFPFSREPFLHARPTHLASSCLLPMGFVWTSCLFLL